MMSIKGEEVIAPVTSEDKAVKRVGFRDTKYVVLKSIDFLPRAKRPIVGEIFKRDEYNFGGLMIANLAALRYITTYVARLTTKESSPPNQTGEQTPTVS